MKLHALIRHFQGIPFVRDLATMQAGKVIYIGITFIASVFFARLLGLTGYGVYAIILSFVGIAKACINMGQAPALHVFFAEEFGKKSKKGMAIVLRNFVQVSLINVFLFLALAYFASDLTGLFYKDASYGKLASLLFIFNAIDLWNGSTVVLLQAIRQIKLKTILEQAENASLAIFAIIFLVHTRTVEAILWAQLMTSILFLPISFAILRHMQSINNLPSIHDVMSVSAKETKSYFLHGIIISVDKNIGNLYPSGLLFILSLVAPASAVGIVRLSLQFATLPTNFILGQINELSTTVLASITRDRITTLRKSSALVMKHTFALYSALIFITIIVIPFLIPVVYGREYANAIPMTIWLLLFSLPSPLVIVNSPLLRLWRKAHHSALFTLGTTVIMWSVIVFLSPVLSPEVAFLSAYLLGQVLPLCLTGYLFLHVMKIPKRPLSQT